MLFIFHNIIKEAKKAHGPKNKLSKCSLAVTLLRNHAVHAPTLSHRQHANPVRRVRQEAYPADATLMFLQVPGLAVCCPASLGSSRQHQMRTR